MNKSLTKQQYLLLGDKLENLENALLAVLKAADELTAVARTSGDGEFQRTFVGELQSYLVGNLREYINHGSQPGSIPSLQDMLEGHE